MNAEIFGTLLLVTSVFTGLFTEALKKQIQSSTNLIAGATSIVLSIAVLIGYSIIFNVAVDSKYIVAGVTLCALSWLCSMLGYDKVIQTIKQIYGGDK